MEVKFKLLGEELLEEKLGEAFDKMSVEQRDEVVSVCFNLLQRDRQLYADFQRLVKYLIEVQKGEQPQQAKKPVAPQQAQQPQEEVYEEDEVIEGEEADEEIDLDTQAKPKKFVMKKKNVL